MGRRGEVVCAGGGGRGGWGGRARARAGIGGRWHRRARGAHVGEQRVLGDGDDLDLERARPALDGLARPQGRAQAAERAVELKGEIYEFIIQVAR